MIKKINESDDDEYDPQPTETMIEEAPSYRGRQSPLR